MVDIENTFVTRNRVAIDFDWAWHIANPNLTPIPGTDYRVPAGDPVYAPLTGYCSWAQMTDGKHMVSIKVGNGDKVTIRELASVSAQAQTAHVTQGDIIGYASTTLSPHVEYDLANGTYQPFENYVTNITPAITIGDEMRLALDPTQKNANGTSLYWVTGNGAPFKFTGDQNAATAIATDNPTIVVAAADWAGFLAGITPPTGTGSEINVNELATALAPLINTGVTEAELVAKLNELGAALKFTPIS